MNCPFCGSGIRPSPGLPGVYQHAENVDTCIIGDLAIKDLAAWIRRASSTTEGGEREKLMERAREIVADDISAMTASWLDTQAFARALLSSPDVRREALEEAANVADGVYAENVLTGPYAHMDDSPEREAARAAATKVANRIRALKETKQ